MRRGLQAALGLALVALLTAVVGAGAQTPGPSDGDWTTWTGTTGATGPWDAGSGWDAPIASFTADPPYETGRHIPLHSTSTHPRGPQHLASYAWDLDGDGAYDDATGPDTTVTFRAPGRYELGLQVTDDQGDSSVRRMPLDVTEPGDDPVASFTVKGKRQVGKMLTFTSTSTGSISRFAWDLDGDGAYDDATGSKVKTKYATPGDRVVGLRVSDDHGNSDVAQQTITIAKKPKPKKQKTTKKS